MQQISPAERTIILRELTRTLLVPGDVVELGCYQGDTSLALARTLQTSAKKLWLYDSFEGLPAKSNRDCASAGEAFQLGALRASKSALIVRFKKTNLPQPIIKKAWFADLKPDDLPATIAFALLDGDFYESIKTSLKLIEPRLAPGTRIVIDDYQSAALPGVAAAVDEWLLNHPQIKLKVENSLAILTV
jgi:O-methyltransferase